MRQMSLITPLLLFISVLFAASAQADEFRGRIVKTQGEVFVLDSKGQKRAPEKTKFLVNVNETVVTGDGGKAVVQFDDGALSVVDEKSKIKVEKSGWLSHISGKIYYLFRKVSGKEKPRKVRTGFTTIGIRGTTFIVIDEKDKQGVALQEGKLNIESLNEPYEIHKPKPVDDFAAFKKQIQEERAALKQEYKKYKDNISKEFIEYKKSFELQANRVISFKGSRVDETELSDDTKEEFDDFSDYAKDYVDAYKELEDEMMK